MPISARKMDRILVRVLGFERRMGRHQIYILRIGGKQVARTLISHGVREIGDDLMATLARQMAEMLGLRLTGTLGLLLDAKQAGLVPAVRPL